jgi:hypothetical protein
LKPHLHRIDGVNSSARYKYNHKYTYIYIYVGKQLKPKVRFAYTYIIERREEPPNDEVYSRVQAGGRLL